MAVKQTPRGLVVVLIEDDVKPIAPEPAPSAPAAQEKVKKSAKPAPASKRGK